MNAGLSERERRSLTTIARACLPGGAVLPAAGAPAAERVSRFLAEAPAAWRLGFRAALASLEADALLAHRRSLAALDDDQAVALVRRLHDGGYSARSRARIVVTAVKLAHYADPSLYRAVGCVFAGPAPATTASPEGCVIDAATIGPGESLACDVVVIGTGAGGAVVARELAERGVSVCVLEEGRYFQRGDFVDLPLARQARLYRNMGATLALGNAAIPVPTGKTVGGTTTINSGTCLRPPPRVFAQWSGELGLTGLDAEALAPHFARVEGVLGVAPNAPRYLGGVARVIARGCDALGYRHGALPRNAPSCDGQGTCAFGCPTDAKRSTNVSYVPLALGAGARLVTGARVERVLHRDGRATGVVVAGPRGSWQVEARAVVVACGAFETPLLLERSGVARASGQLGKNLFIHPSVVAAAEFDEVIDNARSVPQGYAFHGFEEEGIRFAGVFAPLDLAAGMFSLVGRELVDVLERFDRIAGFGAMIEDAPIGRVRAGPGGQPLVTYWTADDVTRRMQRGLAILARVYFAAGARRVLPLVAGWGELRSVADVDRFERATLRARDFDITAYHPGGTARMGRDPKKSVVDARHQVHGTRGLYVVDASVFPTSPAVNPQLTIMALATRAAGKVAEALA